MQEFLRLLWFLRRRNGVSLQQTLASLASLRFLIFKILFGIMIIDLLIINITLLFILHLLDIWWLLCFGVLEIYVLVLLMIIWMIIRILWLNLSIFEILLQDAWEVLWLACVFLFLIESVIHITKILIIEILLIFIKIVLLLTILQIAILRLLLLLLMTSYIDLLIFFEQWFFEIDIEFIFIKWLILTFLLKPLLNMVTHLVLIRFDIIFAIFVLQRYLLQLLIILLHIAYLIHFIVVIVHLLWILHFPGLLGFFTFVNLWFQNLGYLQTFHFLDRWLFFSVEWLIGFQNGSGFHSGLVLLLHHFVLMVPHLLRRMLALHLWIIFWTELSQILVYWSIMFIKNRGARNVIFMPIWLLPTASCSRLVINSSIFYTRIRNIINE